MDWIFLITAGWAAVSIPDPDISDCSAAVTGVVLRLLLYSLSAPQPA